MKKQKTLADIINEEVTKLLMDRYAHGNKLTICSANGRIEKLVITDSMSIDDIKFTKLQSEKFQNAIIGCNSFLTFKSTADNKNIGGVAINYESSLVVSSILENMDGLILKIKLSAAKNGVEFENDEVVKVLENPSFEIPKLKRKGSGMILLHLYPERCEDADEITELLVSRTVGNGLSIGFDLDPSEENAREFIEFLDKYNISSNDIGMVFKNKEDLFIIAKNISEFKEGVPLKNTKTNGHMYESADNAFKRLILLTLVRDLERDSDITIKGSDLDKMEVMFGSLESAIVATKKLSELPNVVGKIDNIDDIYRQANINGVASIGVTIGVSNNAYNKIMRKMNQSDSSNIGFKIQ